ncbi:MAG: primosomal protein N' [bacterium]
MTENRISVVQVAVPVPLRRYFDYQADRDLEPGTRVLVPFGRRKLVGVVISASAQTGTHTLKSVIQVLDDVPCISSSLFTLLSWSSKYYHHPLGEVISTGMPVLLRSPVDLTAPDGDQYIRALPAEPVDKDKLLSRSPAQLKLYQHLADREWTRASELESLFPGWRRAFKALEQKSLAEVRQLFRDPVPAPIKSVVSLNQEQQQAADQIGDHLGQFHVALLQGITGSGKTEVYLTAARECIARGQQVLILVPEISLTPQLVSRVQDQLGGSVCTLHSGMTDHARYRTWWMARHGYADAVLGTRSAVFTPLHNPGLIVVDEEHDVSYKQQDGFRYHARDLAIKRASLDNVPIVLGSATPSMEALFNVRNGRFQLLKLNQRFGPARLPQIHTVNLNLFPAENGLSQPVLSAIEQRLDQAEQVIIYINRRGYSPMVRCYQCLWEAVCARCDARLTYHQKSRQFRCHHCGHSEASEQTCPQCDSALHFAGTGTQRIEQVLLGRFPKARLCRLDRDEASTANKLYRQLETIRNGEADIVIGTQLITKGHDFPAVSLVCVVNADQGLFSTDFRAPEFMFQQLLQVSGRAGRAAANGEVLIQSAFPDDPIMQMIKQHDYEQFANTCLGQREEVGYPPSAYFALFRAESVKQDEALGFLQHARKLGTQIAAGEPLAQVEILSAVPSPMEKLAGRFRAQLLIRCQQRKPLHALLNQWLPMLESSRPAQSVRWSLDIDPMDMS